MFRLQLELAKSHNYEGSGAVSPRVRDRTFIMLLIASAQYLLSGAVMERSTMTSHFYMEELARGVRIPDSDDWRWTDSQK